jgi:hypothetical protein
MLGLIRLFQLILKRSGGCFYKKRKKLRVKERYECKCNLFDRLLEVKIVLKTPKNLKL